MSEAMKWYIVNCQVGSENTAKTSIIERSKTLKMQDQIGEILVPSENVVELVKGKKATRAKKFFPGYLFVQMNLNEKTWHLVRGSSKVSGFVGGKQKPPEVSEAEVMRVTRQMETGMEKVKPKITFSIGENVTVVDGPFSSFSGSVEEINEEKGKVKVLVSIFGRPTPVELDYVQVERA
jgi:transcriptional antiterminator NusG